MHSFIHSLSRLSEGLLCAWALRGSWEHSQRTHKVALGEVSPSTHHKVLLEAGCPSGSGCPGSHHTQRVS